MTWFGDLMVTLKIIHLYENGGGFGFVWNWFHPFTWIMMPTFFILASVIQGVPETWKYKHDIGIGMNPWFIENPDRLKWIKKSSDHSERRH